MNRLFALAVTALLVLAGWALWSGGLFDGTIARQVRTSSVYAAPGTGLDRQAAERAIGNRRLVVILLRPGGDLEGACDSVQKAAEGTLVLAMSRKAADKYETYGCATFGDDDEDFGKHVVSETIISEGIDEFAGRPLDAMKVIVVNYDLLVRSGIVPDGARSISPSLPRYLVALAAISAVVLGSAVVFLAGRRAGRLAASRAEGRAAIGDEQNRLVAGVTVLAQRIIDLDAVPRRETRELAAEYADLLDSLPPLAPDAARPRKASKVGKGSPEDVEGPGADRKALQSRVDALIERAQSIT